MRKELTDKMRADMAQVQVDFLKANYKYIMTGDYEALKKPLAEGLKGYSQEVVSVNSNVKMKLLENLQGETDRTVVRLLKTTRWINKLSDEEDVKESHLMKLYENDKTAVRAVRNYGKRTSQLLSDYLRIRGLIE